MDLTSAERILLERRLLRHGRRRSGLPQVAGLAMLAIVALPLAVLAAGGVAGAIVYAALADELEAGVKSLQALDRREIYQTSRIYDRNGVLLRELNPHGERRTYVPLAEIPLTVREATIAVEDNTFYTNPGIDVGGFLRAVTGELTGEPGLGGGSTITQQFVRHVAFSDKERLARSYSRKAKEIVLALILTRQKSKDQIFEWYLNEIYYGNLAYGIEAAAQTVFGKPARELDLSESALLAALPKAPGDLDPLNPDPDVQEAVRARQRLVLDLMADNGFITSSEADAAAAQELAYAEPDDDLFLAPHFVVYVQDAVEEMLGADRLAKGGLEITTSLDMSLQDLGQSTVAEQVDKLRERQNMTNAALVAMEPRTGQILAMVGSADFWNKDIDGEVNVALRERQPGSSIKPITYLAAIDGGMPTSTLIWDTPLEIWTSSGQYKPHNYDDKFHGPVRLRAALANSYNIPALKLMLKLGTPENPLDGVRKTIDMAHRLGISGLQKAPEYYGITLTLGGGEVTLLDLANAFATIANGGERVSPHPILRITDRSGASLYDLGKDEQALKPEEVVSKEAAYIVTNILSDNNARTPAFGSSSPLNIGVPAAAKTGTTDEYRDNWTLGFTPYLTVGVWAGNSDNSKMVRSSGVTGAAPIWGAFMRGVVYNKERKAVVTGAREAFGYEVHTDFERPEGVIERQVCRLASLNQVASGCPELETELFTKEMLGGAPDGTAPAPGAAGTPDAEGAAPDFWQLSPAVVLPMPPPPDEMVREAAAKGETLNWPRAQLCLAGGHGLGDDKAQPVAVLPLPLDEEERNSVIEWAANNAWSAVEPSRLCSPEMVAAALPPGSLPTGYVPGAMSWSPSASGTAGAPVHAEFRLNLAPGARVVATTALTGTVVYDPAEVGYYKVELGSGTQPESWITLGTTHDGPVNNGVLETLDAPSLPPGDYVVRLVLVKIDGNFLGSPYSVPIRIGQ